MAKGIFDTKGDSGYKDDITQHYHFPNNYRSAAERCVGDWIIYRAPSRNKGSSGYMAYAFVRSVIPDPDSRKHSYALVDGFLPFDRYVPLEGPNGPYEALLRGVAKKDRGLTLRGHSVRPLDKADFADIFLAGLDQTLAPDNALRLELDPASTDEATAALVEAPHDEQVRRIEQIIINKKIRDAAFRRQVVDAYNGTCAVTGLRIINGGGKAEAQAAHIWAVKDGGPDVVQNGIALSGTAHWLFDRHLISLTDDYGLLVSHNKVPEEYRSLFGRQLQRIHLPADRNAWPHPAYIRKHREQFADA